MGQRALLNVLKVGGSAADAPHAEALQYLYSSRIPISFVISIIYYLLAVKLGDANSPPLV